jgi:serine/threonine protein kinase
MKVVTLSDFHRELSKRVEAEIDILSSLRHPNIVEYLGHFHSGTELKIFMELMDLTLHRFNEDMKRSNRLMNERDRYFVASAVATGLRYLHERKEGMIIHSKRKR